MKLALLVPSVVALSFVCGMVFQSARAGTPGAGEPRVTGIGGIFFKAQDAQKLAAWYRDHLGITFPAETNQGGAPSYHPFEWRDKDHPERAGVTVWAVFPHDTKYFDPSKAPFMINYRVANLDHLLAQLRAEGVQVDSKTDEEANGRFGWATDPEGNRFELWQPKE